MERIDHPWIDETNAPLYHWRLPNNPPELELFACFEARERWAAVARFSVAWLVDLNGLLHATSAQRRAFAEHLKRFEPHDIAWNKGSAIIVPSPIVRGIVTAVFWLMTPKFPNRVFSDRTRALEWADAQLKAGQLKTGG